MIQTDEEIRKDWREDFDLDNFTKNDDRYECIADWWLSKLHSLQKEEKEELNKKIQNLKHLLGDSEIKIQKGKFVVKDKKVV